MIKKQFTLYVENRSGVLAKIARMLAKEKINIDGISVAESTDVGLIQIVVSSATRTRKVLKAAKIPFTVQDVSLLSLKNVPGSLWGVVEELAKQDINLNYVYATGCKGREGCHAFAVISAPDLGKVEAAWHQVCAPE